MNDSVTVLRTLGPSLAKSWLVDGTIKNYDQAKHFTVREHAIADLPALHELIAKLTLDSRSGVIRGRHNGPVPHTPVQRNLSTFVDAPSHLFTIDCDGFVPLSVDPVEDPQTAVAEFVQTLPECFREAGYVWQLSGSFGHPSKAGQLRCHLYFLLYEPMTCAQAEAWSRLYLPAQDHTVHRAVQLNYTSAPLIEAPQTDPVTERLGYVEGTLCDAVIISSDMPVPDVSNEKRVTHNRRHQMVDPKGKAGVVGAVCRAFDPERIIDLFPDQFEAGSTAHRITWLHGGGSTEGVRVTDDQAHLYNSHATAPLQRAANVFDFIRAHVFGHLDQGVDQDALDLDVTAAPSYRQMAAWALAQPEVQAEFTGPQAEAADMAAAESKRAVQLGNDHARLVGDLLREVGEAPDVGSLEVVIGEPVTRSPQFSPTDREVLAQAMQKRSAVLMGGRGLPIALVRSWLLIKPLSLTQVFSDLDERNKPKATIENVEALCARLGCVIRYNVINKRQEILRDEWMQYAKTDNADSTLLTRLQSECARVDLPYGLSTVKGYVCAIADQIHYNPVQSWIDERPWDGRSRVQELVDTFKTTAGFDAALKYLMIRKWLVQAVAVACSPVPIQVRGVLVVVGDQYIGKSRWLKTLVPGREELVVLGRMVDPRDKDTIKTAISHWIFELGELDATFKRSDISSLKAFISQDEDTFRLPYAASDSKFQRRSVAFASVNGDNFLHDTTGNTRWWCIPVERMDCEHGIDMQQLWAEIHHLWQGGEPHWLTQDEMALVNLSSTAHEAVDPIMEKLALKFAWDAARDDADAVDWETISATEALTRIGVTNPSGSETKRASDSLKRLGAVKASRTKTTRGWVVPVEKPYVNSGQ